jgi:tetratricopeptide (TPR) repeat protein
MKKFWIVIGIAALLFSAGCGKDSSSGPSGPTAAELTAEAWGYYDVNDYDNSLDKFNEAIDKDGNYYEAYLGRAFTYLADPTHFSDSLAASDLESRIYANRTAIVNAGQEATVLRPAYAAILGYKIKSTTQYSFVHTNLYTTLNNITLAWEFEHNNGDLELNGPMVHLNLAEMYFYFPAATDTHHSRAVAQLTMVRNWAGYSGMPQYLKDKADALYAQFVDSGLIDK